MKKHIYIRKYYLDHLASGQVISGYKNGKLVEDSRPKDFWVFLAETESTQRTETFMAAYE
jgi:hypothetical protein